MNRLNFPVLFLVFSSILVSCEKQSSDSYSGSKNAESNISANKLLLISFDGFRYDYLNKTETPAFDSLIANGVKAEGLIPVFPTKTFPNHYSIATGLYPENSGLIANTMYDPEFKAWYRLSDREAVEDARWYKGEPIWNTADKQGLKAGTMFWIGSEAPIQDRRPTYWKPFDGNMPYKARVDTVVKWLTYEDDRAVDFATLYFELVDNAGHRWGTDSDSLKAAIRKADQLMGYLKNKLQEEKAWERLNLIVLSDHGMIDLSANKTLMLDSIIDMDAVERIVWAPVTMIEPAEGKKEEIFAALKDKENENNYKVYKKEALPERYHLKNNRRVPEIIIVADPGYTILDASSLERFKKSLPSATHGYDNKLKEMRALFIARGPSFKECAKISDFQNIHLYELMNYLLGTRPAPNDGSIDSVKVMLGK